jgi:hypothetical protein
MKRLSVIERVVVWILDGAVWLCPKFLGPTVHAMQGWWERTFHQHLHQGVFVLAIVFALACLIYAFCLGVRQWAELSRRHDEKARQT